MTLSRENFDHVRILLRQRSGHVLEEDKVYLVETRLLSLAIRHGFPTVDDLVLSLRGRRSESLIGEVVEAMTINETYFFRDGHPFEALRQTVLPELIRSRAATRTLNIWSAACSSGQEPYSVALILRHYFPVLADWNIRLIATDLSLGMLERARTGRYSDLEVSRGLPPHLLDAYFKREQGGWQIREEIRRMVDFRPLNLSGVWPWLPFLDLVLMRNVLIYFDVTTRQQILDRVHRMIQPDGYLILGGAETTHNLTDCFVPVSFQQTTMFRPQVAASF